MPKFVGLINWTDHGVKNVKDTVDRASHAKEAFSNMGVNMELLYWTAGRHDIVAIFDAPDDKTVSAAALKIASQGSIRTELLRAYDETEMTEILGMLES
jgi:uncharacterized protein with GYD domain